MNPSRPATEPLSREAIAEELDTIHAESVRYWSTLSTATFLAPIGEAWSPRENVRHLTRSVRAVTRGLRLPRFVVRLSFGAARRASRSLEEMRGWYLGALTPGFRAAAFAPSRRHTGDDPEGERTRIMAQHAAAIRALREATLRWSERHLDRCRLPHPLLGPLTVREMLLFTLLHNRHHVAGVQRRLATHVASGS